MCAAAAAEPGAGMEAAPLGHAPRAPLVLARATEVLVAYGCAFKFALGLDRVTEIVSRQVDRGAGADFLTVYPDTDEEVLRELAERLHRSTRGLPGPGVLSDRRYRPGSLVHYRFGAFTGVPRLGNDGLRQAMLLGPGGAVVPDERRAWFWLPPWAPPDPFTPRGPERATTLPYSTTLRGGPVLLAGRYAVSEAVRHAVLRWGLPRERPADREPGHHQAGPAPHGSRPDRAGFVRPAPARGGDAAAVRLQRRGRPAGRPVRTAGRPVPGAGAHRGPDRAGLGAQPPRAGRRRRVAGGPRAGGRGGSGLPAGVGTQRPQPEQRDRDRRRDGAADRSGTGVDGRRAGAAGVHPGL